MKAFASFSAAIFLPSNLSQEKLRGWNTLLVFALSAPLFEYKSKQKREWNVILFGISLKFFFLSRIFPHSYFFVSEFKSAIEQQWDLKELRALISFLFLSFFFFLHSFEDFWKTFFHFFFVRIVQLSKWKRKRKKVKNSWKISSFYEF